ncbi:MAG: SDR family oxidoreductase [Burkholderiales bacterium]
MSSLSSQEQAPGQSEPTTGPVVIVSGADSAIGREVACAFSRLGARLLICGADAVGLDACAAALRLEGAPEAQVLSLNAGEADQAEKLLDDAWRHFGRVDVLVNIASQPAAQSALTCSASEWKSVIQTHLNGTWYMMQAAARRWRDAGAPGGVVNVVGTFQRGTPGLAHQCAASTAVNYLSRTVAVEWAEYRIRVNCVAAGVIATSTAMTAPESTAKTLASVNVMKREGRARDVADAVVYLAGPRGEFITGELLTVDGGGTLWGETWATPKPDYYRLSP